ncbi:MAG: GH36 C-terminal domain-containing protein, partial [Alistipes sp.]|nr:GH36 C-terminal domain-containing protein [Alistipes sp.]
VWLAYQLNRPSDGSGVVMAFRRKDNPQESLTVQLQGLQADATYTVQSETDGSLSTHSGAELAQGFSLTIPQTPGAVMLRYSLTSASQK